MAVLGRLLVSSAERLDLPDLLSLDSYAAGDWKYFLKGMVGDTKPFILKGFDVIDPGNAIGTQSCSIRVADSITFYPGSNSGSFFHGLQEGHPQAAPLVPELRKNAVNYVYLTFSTFNTSVDTRAFWDPDKDGGVGGEFTQDINTESVLKVDINVSTGSFPANTVPVAKITVGPVVITAIEDARDMMFRLGSGGINPNPFNTYGWRSLPSAGYERSEPPTQMLAGGVNPFQGADKNILTLKEWMDAVMSKLRELGGTTYWYDDTSSFSIITNFYDAVATTFKSKGKWLHDTVTPGLLTWTEDIQIKMTSDPRTYIIRQGSKQLADEQVMYIGMQRNLPFNATDENVQWTNGQLYVNTIGGAVGLFANLSKGDYIKKANDTIDKWVRVEEFYDAVNLGGSTTTAAGARSVRIGSAYLGVTGAEKGRYDKGVYLPSEVTVSDRDDAAIGLAGGQFHWLAIRSDTIESVASIVTTDLAVDIDQHDGSTARVTSVAHGLVDGDRVTIAGTTNFDGTYQVEVETADIFYISVSGGPFGDESGTAHYAMVTTAARVTPYGFQEESANHGFNTDDDIIIDGTTNYDGSYEVSVRSATTFTIPVPGPTATENVGTATLARVIVRTEGAGIELIQGQVIDIGGSVADNIRQYVGMASLSETQPNYSIPPSYNTLDGMQNYNGVIGENLTARLSKVTAMMADKAQDKTIQILPSAGITAITNTANGLAQELRFEPDGSSITIVTPSSDGQTFMALPGSVTPISLLEDQAAYITIDRNAPSTVTWTVADIVDVPLEENVFVIATRLNTPDIYLWDASFVPTGSSPPPPFLVTVVNQNNNMKLIEGGTWSWASGGGSTPGNFAANAVGGTAVDFTGVTTNMYAQRFLATNSGDITTAELHLAASGGAPGGTLTLRLYSDVAGQPGVLLATSDAMDATGLYAGSIPYPAFQFNFSAPYTLVSGTHYHIALRTDAYTGTFIFLEGSNADPYADGTVNFSNNNGVSWTDLAPEDYTFSVDGLIADSSFTLTWDQDAYIQIPGLTEGRNTIPADSIVFANDGEVAYVDINRTAGANNNLAITIAAVDTVVLGTDTVVIARRVGDEIIVGNNSMLLVEDESKSLYAGASNETLSALGLDSEADKGALRILEQVGGASKRVIISPIDTVVFDNTTWGNEISGLRMQFDGIQLDLETGDYYEYGDGTLAGSGPLVGSAFTPVAFTSPNLFRWYSINFVADTLNADGTMSVAPLILQGADGASSSTAVKAPMSSKKVGQVLVQAPGSGLTINNITQASVVQLASGAGGGGSGASPKMIGGGTFTWNIGSTSLSFTSDIFIEQARLDYTDNTIDQATVSPIVLPTTDHVAYIDRLNASSGGADLTVLVDLITNVKDGQIIIARRDGADVIVGSSSTRLRTGQSSELFAQESIQSRNTLRSTDFLRSDNPVTWTGTDLLFTADIVLETLNTRNGLTKLFTIDVSESPLVLADGEVCYVAIDREAAAGPVTPVIAASVPTVTEENIEYIMLFKRVDALGVGYLHIPLHKQVIEPGQTVRLGASGSGSGDIGLQDRLLERLVDSPWELLTPNLFAINEDDLVDPSSTGDYSLVSKTFELPVIGNTLVSTNMLDPDEFLNNDDDLQETELIVYWNEDGIDTAATYEVSRNAGLEWQTIEMERVGNTETWRGTHLFEDEASNQVLQQEALAGADSDIDLDSGTTRQRLAQPFTVTDKQLLRQITISLTKVGSPSGFYKVSVVADNGGTPDTVSISESVLRPLSAVASGTNDVTIDMPEVVLTAGTYYWIIEGDAAYRSSYVNGVTELAPRRNSAATALIQQYNGTAWSPTGSGSLVYEILGIELDLRVRITSGTTDVMLNGYGIFYDKAPGQIATGIRNIEVFQFDGSLNTTDFLVSNFTVNPEQLKVYDINTGQVYRYGAFTVSGQTVQFTTGQFYDPGKTIKLMFDQTTGGAFDNSDVNGLLLASNFLGSTDASIDRSVAGRGIFLRRPDGTLREITIDNSDNIVVYSV